MTPAVQQLLNSFDALADAEKQEAAMAILRRINAEGDLPEAAFVEVADELLRSLDAEEAGHGQR